jgi:hypothetical protein
MKNLLKALSEFQDEVPTIHEETKGYNYTYSNLNSIFKVIKPLLKKHGLGFYQNLDARSLVTTIYHVESGEQIQSSSDIPNISLKGMNDYQTLGSGITYLRRYSLSTMLGLITDKDIDACGTQDQIIYVTGRKTFTAVDAQAEKLKGTDVKDLKKKYIITDQQIEKYNNLN